MKNGSANIKLKRNRKVGKCMMTENDSDRIITMIIAIAIVMAIAL